PGNGKLVNISVMPAQLFDSAPPKIEVNKHTKIGTQERNTPSSAIDQWFKYYQKPLPQSHSL
ncbi:unnamed protein product, partial [Orchesella dallaii]